MAYNGSIRTFDTIAEIKLQKGSPSANINVLGYNTPGDGGGGEFYWDDVSTQSDNAGTIIQVTGLSTGRWKRIYHGAALNVRWFGAVSNGTNGEMDTTGFEKAIAVQRSVFVPNGVYQIIRTLNLFSGYNVTGESWNTLIRTALDIPIFKNTPISFQFLQSVKIENLRLQNTFPVTATAGCTSYHIHFVDPTYCSVNKVWFTTAFPNTIYNTVNRGGIRFEKTGTVTSFVNTVENCIIEGGSVRMETSDSKISSSYIWGYAIGTPTVDIQTGNVSVTNCDIVPNSTHDGVLLGSNTANCRIVDCFFDGSYDTITTGYGVVVNGSTNHTITGNTFWNIAKGAIHITDGTLISISANTFLNNNRANNFFSDITVQGNSFSPGQITATGNSFYMQFARSNKGYAIEEKSTAGFPPGGNNYSNNRIFGNYTSPSILNMVGTSSTWGSSGAGVASTMGIGGERFDLKGRVNINGATDISTTALNVNGTSRVGAGNGVTAIQFRAGEPAYGYWEFVNAGTTTNRVLLRSFDNTVTEKIRIDPLSDSFIINKFGIGTNSPATLLDVNGTATIRGNATFAANGTPGISKVPTGTDTAGNWTWQTSSPTSFITGVLSAGTNWGFLTSWDNNSSTCVSPDPINRVYAVTSNNSSIVTIEASLIINNTSNFADNSRQAIATVPVGFRPQNYINFSACQLVVGNDYCLSGSSLTGTQTISFLSVTITPAGTILVYKGTTTSNISVSSVNRVVIPVHITYTISPVS